MNTDYKIVYEPSLKANNKQVDSLVADNVDNMTKNPVYKAVIPQYLAKPFWGYPRYQALPFLRGLGKNVYASSVMKQVKDLVIDTPFDIVVEEGIQSTPELEQEILKIKEFISKPNPDEEYDDFTRKWLDDAFKYDSGVINKVFNPLGELLQLRVADGATFLKNPDKHGYLDQREDIIFNKPSITGVTADKGDWNKLAFNFGYMYSNTAAYFQYVNNIASQLPIPFGKREIIWVSFNPSSDNVYTNGSYLEDSVDLLLSLVYGVKYNLDFYQNGNTPEGIINAVGATKKDLIKIKSQLDHSIRTPKDAFGMSRRMGYRMPVVSMDNLDFVKLNLTSQEMEIINQQKWFTKIFFMRFGLNADELGFTEDSNRATSTQQSKNAKRKALAPIFRKIENIYNYNVLNEFPNGNKLRFKFNFYDVIEEKTKRELQQLEIQMGINSAKMIADEEGLDYNQLKKDREEEQEAFTFPDSNVQGDKPQDKKNTDNLKKEEVKSFGAGIGGEGTTDYIMNPVRSKKKETKGESQLEKGTRLESEHKETYEFIKEYLEKHGKLPSQDEVFRQIAGNHLEENPDYYKEVEEGKKEKLVNVKSKPVEPPKKLALEIATEEYAKEFESLVKEIIDKAK